MENPDQFSAQINTQGICAPSPSAATAHENGSRALPTRCSSKSFRARFVHEPGAGRDRAVIRARYGARRSSPRPPLPPCALELQPLADLDAARERASGKAGFHRRPDRAAPI